MERLQYNWILRYSTFQTFNVKTPIQPGISKLKSYSGHDIQVKGFSTLSCQHKDNTYTLGFYIAKNHGSTIISAQACEQLQLIQRVNTVSNDNFNTNM